MLGAAADPAPEGKPVAAHVRRPARRDVAQAEAAEAMPFFDRARVPVERIELVPEEIKALAPEQYELIGCKTTYRLAQRPGLCGARVRASGDQAKGSPPRCTGARDPCAPAPAGVIEGSPARM